MSWLSYHKKSFINSFGGKVSLLFLSLILFSSLVFAVHDTTVSLSPDIANCSDSGNEFVVTIANDALSIDDIFEVRIYQGTVGNLDFSCGSAPAGWELFDFTAIYGYCEYKTQQITGGNRILPGTSQDFNFTAAMEPSSCASSFLISTLDNAQPVGEHEYKQPEVRIDCSPPVVEKTVNDPKILIDDQCNPATEICDYWITQDTVIDVFGSDSIKDDECNLGLEQCQWRYSLDGGNFSQWAPYTNDGDIYFDFSFAEDSEHLIEIECTDIAGNKTTITETDKVDSTPPDSNKHFTGPLKIENGVEWIDGISTVVIESSDPDPTEHGCNIGEVKTYFNLSGPVDDSYCLNSCEGWQTGIPNASGDGWTEYTAPLAGIEEACHVLEYYSVDKIGNIEDVKTNCFFVDKTPPLVDKTVGDPQYVCEDGDNCDYYITSETPITLTCEDQLPHPSGDVVLSWRYRVNEGLDFGDWMGFSQQTEETTIFFPEQSMHELEYWCTDAVGKESEHFFEIDKVDNEPPIITKTMNGDYKGICPPGQGDDCYILPFETEIQVSVNDVQSIHAVNNVSCKWGYDYEGEFYGWNYPKTNDWTIIFEEDSTHELTIECWDALGNTATDVETFLVDGNPPVTTKTYGEPYVYGSGPEEWITSLTPVWLNSVDEKVGVEEIYWRNMVISAEEGWDACYNPADFCTPDYYSQWVDNFESPWNIVPGNFTEFFKAEESCHVIEFYSIDKLGNEELLQWQCPFVDNTPPQGTKEIGEPYVIKLGQDCNVEVQGDQAPPVDSLYAVGDEVFTMNFPEGSGTGVGVAFDGEFLYYTYIDSTNLYKIRPDGSGHEVIPTTGIAESGLGALSFDATRGMLWTGTYGCDQSGGGPVYLIDPVTGAATYQFSVPSQYVSYCLDDGIAFDATDDSIWYSDDVQSIMVHMASDGTFLGTVDLSAIHPDLVQNSGIAIGGENFYLGTNGFETTLRVHRNDLTILDTFVNTNYRIEDMECDPQTYFPTEVMWIRDAYDGSARAYAIESGTCGLGGQAPAPQCEDTEEFVTTDTPFFLSCEDAYPHPVERETLCYKVSLEDNGYEDITGNYCEPNQDGWCCTERGAMEFNFQEDSYHNLEYYCTDGLGNANEIDLEYFTVETVPPVITKTVEGPQIGTCPAIEEGDECIIDGVTEIHVDAVDPTPHPVDSVICDWSYALLDGNASGGETGITPPFVINFPEESRHQLEITCWDALGNTSSDYSEFVVDKTPPVIKKGFGDPYFTEEGLEWITTQTPIYAEAYDPEPHPSGLALIEYKVSLVEEENCRDIELCQGIEGTGNWTEYSEEGFYAGEESCHLIEIKATDNVDKFSVHKQCVFVDETAPETVKTVGEPSDPWNGMDSAYYPEIGELCWNGQGNEMECWKVTLLTPITMACNDLDPHPVDHETIYFKVELDADDTTENYCETYEGTMTDDGWCHINQKELQFYFTEETEHNLKYYCEDALGNIGTIDDEKFKVEGTTFEIELNKKWNLVSVPFVLINDDIEDVFSDVMDNVESVWTYDAFTDSWYVYHPGQPELSNLDSITPGWGYWIRAYEADTLLLGGSLFSPAVTPPSRDLKDGWNLIGYYGLEGQEGYNGPEGNGKEAGCALYSLGDSYLDKGWTSLVSYWELYNTDGDPNTSLWSEFDYYANLDPGAGYWIDSSGNNTYAYTTNCGFFD